ncbi:MAG: sulfatase [Pirellula sp.]
MMKSLSIAFVCSFTWFCSVAGSVNEAMSAEQVQKRNVLFLMSDDMRPVLGCYGHTIVESPNIDSLARVGVRFDRAYCQYPLCNPSRTSLLTGRHPTTTGVLNNVIDFRKNHPDWVSLPQLFRTNGYASLRCGKIFHGGIDDALAWDQGGDAPRPNHDDRKPVDNTSRIPQSDRIVALKDDGQEHQDYRIGDTAIRYLKDYRDKPFFLCCGFTRPHSPPTAPQKIIDRYAAMNTPLPATFAAIPAAPANFPSISITANSDLFVKREASREEATKMLQAYYASVTWTDWNVGRVLKELDVLGLRQNTIVVFWGDHGYHLGEFGKWAKHGSLFELGTRVPLIVSAPGMSGNGQTVSSPVQTLDLYPTLCNLCGIAPPPGIEGHDLVPLLKNVNAPWNYPAYSVAGTAAKLGVAVRTNQYRYAEWTNGKDGSMLIVETIDANETNNLVGDPKYADVVKVLSQLAKEHAKAISPK